MLCLTRDLLGFAQSGLEHLKIIWGHFSGSLGSLLWLFGVGLPSLAKMGAPA